MRTKTKLENGEVLNDQISAQCSRRLRMRLQRLARKLGGASESSVIRDGLESYVAAEEARLGLPSLVAEEKTLEKLLKGA